MTVLFLSRFFYPHIGGVEGHVLEVATRLTGLGYKVKIVTEAFSPNVKFQMSNFKSISNNQSSNIKIYRVPTTANERLKKFRIWWWLWRHRQLIKKADIVHCHDVFFWYLPFRFLYPQKPVYTTFHGYETKFPPSKKAIFVRKISERLSFGSICVGDYIKKWYGTKPNDITYGGVDVHLGGVEVVASPLKILFIGRVEEDMGIPIYLKSLEMLKQEKINFEFEVCGDGFLANHVAQYYKVHGFVRDLDSYISKADFIFSSSYLSMLQALVLKRLVFAVFDNPIKEDYLKMSPFAKWIVIEKNPKAIAEKIKYYLTRPKEKEKMIEPAYNWVKDQTWDKVTNIYLKLWI